jgi:hypothetical protein
MQAYDVGGNQIRYDGVWEPGGTGQDGVNAWTLNDFAAKFDGPSTTSPPGTEKSRQKAIG